MSTPQKKSKKQIDGLYDSLTQVIGGLKNDVQTAEELLKKRLPKRFEKIKGFQVASRYLAGTRPGGDYLDLEDSSDGKQLSLILTQSTSYRLSNQILSTLANLTLNHEEVKVPTVAVAVRRIFDDLKPVFKAVLKDRHHISLFYGTYSRRDRLFHYLHLGGTSVFYAAPGGSYEVIQRQSEALTLTPESSSELPLPGSLQIAPGSRIILISEGWVEALGGKTQLLAVLTSKRDHDGLDILNELVYRVKSQLTEDETMPCQDCTGLVLDAGIDGLTVVK